MATPEHQVFANGGYHEVQSLHQGDTLYDANGAYHLVEKVTTLTVYNFEVESAQNYYVGELALLAHNACNLPKVAKKHEGVTDHKLPQLKARLDAIKNLDPDVRAAFTTKINDLDDPVVIKTFLDDFAENDAAIAEFLKKPELVDSWRAFKNKELDDIASSGGSLARKLDDALFAGLKSKVDDLGEVLKPQFLDDFADASDDLLKKSQDDNLFDVWNSDLRSNNVDELIEYCSRENLRSECIVVVEAIRDKAAELRGLGKTDLEIAQEVFNLRRQTTIGFKNITAGDMLPLIFECNDIRYTQKGLGGKWGLSWSGDFSKATKYGVTDYHRIISGSSTSLGDKLKLGKSLYETVGSKDLPTLEKIPHDEFNTLV